MRKMARKYNGNGNVTPECSLEGSVLAVAIEVARVLEREGDKRGRAKNKIQ